MKIGELLNEGKSSRQSIFESIGQGDQYFRTWERDIHPVLCEVALQPDQVQQLFKSIEAGAGRSMLGKGLDAVGAAKDKISDVWFNKFGGMLQSSGPVQAFDQKFEEIKTSIAAKNPELAAKLAKYGEFAKNNPNLHKFLLAIAGSAAAALGVAVAGGVGAGALAVGTGTGIAVGILNIADRLLQGQKASTAIGRGATTGAVAGLAAGAAAKIASMVKAGFHSELIDTIGKNKIMKGTFDNNGQWSFVTGKVEDVRAASAAFDQQNWQTFGALVQKMRSPEYLQSLDASREIIKQAVSHYKETAGVIKTLSQIATSAAGGAASAGMSSSGQQPTPMSEGQINELFGITGNKVDASKLQKAWTKAGSPMDSEEVAKILQKAGVDTTVISKAYADMSLPAPAVSTPAAEPKEPTLSPAPAPGTPPAPAPGTPPAAALSPDDAELSAIKKNAGLPAAAPAPAGTAPVAAPTTPTPAVAPTTPTPAVAPIQAQPAGMRAGRFATKPLAGVTKPGARK